MTLGWGIVGTGTIARRFAGDMRFSRRGRILAVASRDPARAASFAAGIGGSVRAFSLDELLRHPDIGAVYVATPNRSHVEIALRAIRHGKPVLVEKPLALSAGDAERLAQAARTRNVFAMEALWARFTPGFRRVSGEIEAGRIGALRRIEASLAFTREESEGDPLFELAGGGALFDLGVYPVSLAIALAGPADVATASIRRGRNGAPVAATLVLEHAEARSVLTCGFEAEGANELVAAGTRGILRAHGPMLRSPIVSFRATRTVEPTEETGASRRRGRLREQITAARRLVGGLRERRWPDLSPGTGLQYQADHVARCLEDGLQESPLMPLGESAAVIRILEDAARR